MRCGSYAEEVAAPRASKAQDSANDGHVSISAYCNADGSPGVGQPSIKMQVADANNGCQPPSPTAVMGGADVVAGLSGSRQSVRSGAHKEAAYRRLDLLPVPETAAAAAQEPAGSAITGAAPASQGRELPSDAGEQQRVAPCISNVVEQAHLRNESAAAAPELDAQPGAAVPQSPTEDAAAASRVNVHMSDGGADQHSHVTDELHPPWDHRRPAWHQRGAGTAQRGGLAHCLLQRLLCCSVAAVVPGEQEQATRCQSQSPGAHTLTARGVAANARLPAGRAEARRLSTLTWV